MAQSQLDSGAVSAFCESIAVMLSAGITVEESLSMLSESMKDEAMESLCEQLYKHVSSGGKFSEAMRNSGAFPEYAVNMAQAGERAGRLENVMRSLGVYYDEENRLIAKARSNITYPAALMLVMTVILAFTVANILPVFASAYQSLAGTLTTGSFGAINASMIIGWIAFVIMFVCAAFALACAIGIRSPKGREKLNALLERFPLSKKATYQLELSRFTSALGTYVSSGTNNETALSNALSAVKNPLLQSKLTAALEDMTDAQHPLGISQAFSKNDVYDPLHMRMIAVSARSGNLEGTLDSLSTTLFDEATMHIEELIDEIEPALAAFLTIAVGATLISVMIPLIGIMGSIG